MKALLSKTCSSRATPCYTKPSAAGVTLVQNVLHEFFFQKWYNRKHIWANICLQNCTFVSSVNFSSKCSFCNFVKSELKPARLRVSFWFLGFNSWQDSQLLASSWISLFIPGQYTVSRVRRIILSYPRWEACNVFLVWALSDVGITILLPIKIIDNLKTECLLGHNTF